MINKTHYKFVEAEMPLIFFSRDTRTYYSASKMICSGCHKLIEHAVRLYCCWSKRESNTKSMVRTFCGGCVTQGMDLKDGYVRLLSFAQECYLIAIVNKIPEHAKLVPITPPVLAPMGVSASEATHAKYLKGVEVIDNTLIGKGKKRITSLLEFKRKKKEVKEIERSS